MRYCDRPGHEQTHDPDYLQAVINYMVRAYCAGMDVDQHVITIHGHEGGRCDDRLLTLHVATGPESAAALAVHSIMADLTSIVIKNGAGS